jgi:TPR repeat protein
MMRLVVIFVFSLLVFPFTGMSNSCYLLVDQDEKATGLPNAMVIGVTSSLFSQFASPVVPAPASGLRDEDCRYTIKVFTGGGKIMTTISGHNLNAFGTSTKASFSGLEEAILLALYRALPAQQVAICSTYRTSLPQTCQASQQQNQTLASDGALKILIDTASADVFINDMPRGKTTVDEPLKLTELTPGTYQVKAVDSDTFKAVEQTVQIMPGKESQIKLMFAGTDPMVTKNGNHAELKKMYEQALKYHFGWGVKPDPKMVFHWLEKSANGGFAEAQYRLGILYLRGYKGEIEQNDANAFRWLEKATFKDHKNAMYALANQILALESVDRDTPYAKEKGVELLERAAQGGHLNSMFLLGTVYRFGLHVESDKEKALKWLKEGSDSGAGLATRAYKTITKNRFVNRDKLEKKANRGNKKAAFAAGLCYLDGSCDFPQNLNKAEKYLSIAANGGMDGAQVILGEYYLFGVNDNKDIEKAKEYFTMAVPKKNRFALYYLGKMFIEGLGEELTEQNRIKGIRFLKRAKKFGHLGAGKYLEDMKTNLI